MNNSNFKLLLVILLPTISLGCSSSRCSQYYNKRSDEFRDNLLDKSGKITTADNSSQTLLAPVVRFTVAGRHLSGVEEFGTPSAWPRIWINYNMYRDGICLVHNNANPNWGDNLEVTYDAGSNTFLRIEVRSQSEDFWGYDDFFIGQTIIYVKDMLCKGRTIESHLWTGDGGFHTGIIAVTTTDVLNGGGNCN